MIDLPVSPALFWFLIGIGFYALELALPGFIIFFFGIGAWCSALAAYALDISLSVQLIIFIVMSLISLLALRSTLKKIFSGDTKAGTDTTDLASSAATGVVTEKIMPPAKGTIKYAGTFWQASAEEPVEVGTVVEIVEQQDLLVKVRRVQ